MIVENVYTNITITDGNFKSAERTEIILKQLDGVEGIIGWDYADERYESGTINTVYQQTERSGNEFYFDLLPGYTNPTLKVLGNGVEKNVPVVPYDQLDRPTSPRRYDYQFNIENNYGDNVEIYITSEAEEYQVIYDVNGNQTFVTDENIYTILFSVI